LTTASSVVVTLNLFQGLLKKMLKQIQHDFLFPDTVVREYRRMSKNLLVLSDRDDAVQLNSERFRQDEFKGEPAQRTRVREHRRIQKNSLVSTFLNDAVP
jgi:RPE3 domain-containing protein